MNRTGSSFFSRGGGWVLTQFFLMLGIAVLGFQFPSYSTHGAVRWLAGPLILGSAVTGLWGVQSLGRNRTPFPRPVDGSSLVCTGIYAWIRHPLYTSVLLAGLAWAAYRASIPTLIGVGVLTAFLSAKARREERWLIAQFPGYTEYARRVPRFFPWPRSFPPS